MPWLLGGLILLLAAGFAKISTIVVNRMLARPQPKWQIAVTELIQIVLLALYAGLLFNELFKGQAQQVLDSHSTNVVTQFSRYLIAVGVIGLGLLIRSAIAFQRYRPPGRQLCANSQLIDFRITESGQPSTENLVGPGPMRAIATLPGNEQFTVEVSTKVFVLPRLPREWDGLSIVHLTDSHFRGAVTRRYFELVCQQASALKPDLFIFTGDLLDDIQLLDWLPETFGRLKAPLGQYFILGNHDWYLDANSIRREFQRNGWIDLSSRSLEVDSLSAGPAILLAGNEMPWMGHHPQVPAKSNHPFQILLSHTPDNIEWARRHSFDLMLAGHTHGGQIRLPVLGPVYSPSRFGCRFASGVFWLDPTLLYVSRGLSGREPIRYLCTPELTKIVIRAPATCHS